MATARRNALRPPGTRLEARPSTPSANAMSVGIAIPHPRDAGWSGLKAR